MNYNLFQVKKGASLPSIICRLYHLRNDVLAPVLPLPGSLSLLGSSIIPAIPTGLLPSLSLLLSTSTLLRLALPSILLPALSFPASKSLRSSSSFHFSSLTGICFDTFWCQHCCTKEANCITVIQLWAVHSQQRVVFVVLARQRGKG